MPRLTLRLSCAAAALLALSSAWPAHAQSRDTLRGQVPEDAISGELQRLRDEQNKATLAGDPADPAAGANASNTPAYVPLSDGATPDDNDTPARKRDGDSLFGDTAKGGGDAADANDAEPQAKAPSTARERAKAAKARLLPPDQRKKAEQQAKKAAVKTSATAKPDGETTDDQLSTGDIGRARTTDSEDREPLDPAAGREPAIETPKKKSAEDDPYAPLGLRLGSFNVYTTLEQGLNWTSNVNSSPEPEAALQSETTLRVKALSDWSQHEASIEAYGTLRETLDGPKVDDNEAGVESALRLDINDELRAVGTFDYSISPESASSAVVITGAVSEPLHQTIDATAGLEKDIGKLRLSAIAGIDNETYRDATLDTGEKLSQKDRNSTLYNIRLRTGYEVSPALTPFTEIEIGQREYQNRIDAAGYERSADRLAARAGVSVDLGDKLRGEIAAGWLQEKPHDNRLATIAGPAIDANLVWSPERGTSVTLYGNTAVEGTTSPGESGTLLYTLRGSLERQIRADLTASALLGLEWRDYFGSTEHDLTATGELGLTWWLNRYVGLTGRYRHEQLFSNEDGRDYKTDSVLIGMKLQR